jgi:hypothetical protein
LGGGPDIYNIFLIPKVEPLSLIKNSPTEISKIILEWGFETDHPVRGVKFKFFTVLSVG